MARGKEQRAARPTWRALVGVLIFAALGGGVTSPGCASFDTTPLPVTHGSLGEEVVQVFCERMAAEANPSDVSGERWKPVCEGNETPPADAPPRLIALMNNRTRLAEAIDRTLPEEMHDELGHFLGELLPFFDRPDERVPTQTRRLADFLMRLSADDEAIAALGRIGTRQGYRPLRLGLGVTRPVLSYPDFDRFSDLALTSIMEGAAEQEFRDMQTALALEMATFEPSPPSTQPSTTELIRELMFTSNDAFGSGAAQYVLLRDARGMASVVPASDGSVPLPFRDDDGDGLPDVDSLGRFAVAGTPVEVASPFPVLNEAGVARDPDGRALRMDGTRYYEYIDANRTMLAGTVAELSPWFSPETPIVLQMMRGLPVMMGPEQNVSSAYGSYSLLYRSFDTQAGPMFDVVHALGELLHRGETYDALLVTEALLADQESAAAGMMRVGRFMANQSDLHPDAQLTQPNVFWDDLIALLVRIAQRPGMLEAVMRSFSDPRSAEAGPLYAQFMRNRDRVTFDPANPNGAPIGFPLDQAVDRSMADTFDNESLWQRTLALIDGLNGVEVCNRDGAKLNLIVSLGPLNIPLEWPLFGTASRCELIRIENVAEAYARAIMGTYELEIQDGLLNTLVIVGGALGIDIDGALEASSGIDGMTQRPTPQALNRLVFWGMSDSTGLASCTPGMDGGDCNSQFAGQLFDPVVDRHGNLVVERHHGTIFAWESPGFYNGLRPLVEALHRPGFTFDFDGTYFFGELLGLLSRHWASPANPQTCGAPTCSLGDNNFSYQSNVRSYEALVAQGFEEGMDGGGLASRLYELNVALEAIEIRPGVDGVAALSAIGESMIDPMQNPALTDRRGRSMASWNDGSRTVPMTPLYLLLDALSATDDAWVGQDARHADWLSARSAMGEQFLGADPIGTGFTMRNQRGRNVLLTALPFVRRRIDAHRTDGDLLTWSTGLHARLADTVREPLMASLVFFLDAINVDPMARDALTALLAYLMNQASENDAFASTLYGAADALMILNDDLNIVPLMHALSEAMAPNVNDIVTSGGSLDLDASAVRDALDLMGDIADVDDERTLRRVLQNAVAIPDAGSEITPLEVIVDVIAEVNRATPDEGGGLRADDYRAVLGNVTDFMLDEDHGLERLNAVVQNRGCFPEQRRACTVAGDSIESSGLCYVGARCSCTECLTWTCSRP